MSKLSELIKKYPQITHATANKISDADTTKTKKYLEYMIKIWVNRKDNNCPKTVAKLCFHVKEFDELLPYIKNKDIYSNEYSDFNNLLNAIDDAVEEKENKIFVKEDNIHVLDETEDYIFLIPKTHLGSCRYGAKTKWCTAARNDAQTFKRYSKNGCLAYLISKKNDKEKNANKIAFYIEHQNKPFSAEIYIYNSLDTSINDRVFINAGWSEELLIKMMSIFRIMASRKEKTDTSIKEIDKYIITLANINILDLEKHISVVENSINKEYIFTVKNSLDEFINKIKKFQNAE